MMDPEKVKTYLETGIIEIAPLAFMRGRTLNDSFVILDEGQNTTADQMKMFLTRLGYSSKAVVTRRCDADGSSGGEGVGAHSRAEGSEGNPRDRVHIFR